MVNIKFSLQYKFTAKQTGDKNVKTQQLGLTWGGVKNSTSLPPEGPLYEKAHDARCKIWIEPIKKTNLGVADGLFHPSKTTLQTG